MRDMLQSRYLHSNVAHKQLARTSLNVHLDYNLHLSVTIYKNFFGWVNFMQESFDPDLNLQLLNDHGIYTIEEIIELSRTVKPQYSAIHLNSRSLKQHFDEMCNLLDSISCKFDFIACSETWFTSETDNTCFQIPGYTLVNDNLFDRWWCRFVC